MSTFNDSADEDFCDSDNASNHDSTLDDDEDLLDNELTLDVGISIVADDNDYDLINCGDDDEEADDDEEDEDNNNDDNDFNDTNLDNNEENQIRSSISQTSKTVISPTKTIPTSTTNNNNNHTTSINLTNYSIAEEENENETNTDENFHNINIGDFVSVIMDDDQSHNDDNITDGRIQKKLIEQSTNNMEQALKELANNKNISIFPTSNVRSCRNHTIDHPITTITAIDSLSNHKCNVNNFHNFDMSRYSFPSNVESTTAEQQQFHDDSMNATAVALTSLQALSNSLSIDTSHHPKDFYDRRTLSLDFSRNEILEKAKPGTWLYGRILESTPLKASSILTQYLNVESIDIAYMAPNNTTSVTFYTKKK